MRNAATRWAASVAVLAVWVALPSGASAQTAANADAQSYAHESTSLMGGAVFETVNAQGTSATLISVGPEFRVVRWGGLTAEIGASLSWRAGGGSGSETVFGLSLGVGYTLPLVSLLTTSPLLSYRFGFVHDENFAFSQDLVVHVVTAVLPITIHLTAHSFIELYFEPGFLFGDRINTSFTFSSGERLGIVF